MTVKTLTEKDKTLINALATHPLQSYEWGEFRKTTGVKVIRKGIFDEKKCVTAFQMTLHPIPYTNLTIGYIPKGAMPTREMVAAIQEVARENRCIFVQLEPNVFDSKENKQKLFALHLQPSAHPLFTRYTFHLNLSETEAVLLNNMHQKTRYNIRVAQKHGVVVKEETSDDAFDTYWRLMEETAKRQHFYAHTQTYHALMWKTLRTKIADRKREAENGLTSHLFIAWYKPEGQSKAISLAAWILFIFHDTLYYPYGASSSQYRNTMASNLMMWEAIRFGKKMGLKNLDMWGSLGENPDQTDPWYGFHRLKMGYNPRLITFIGSYDLVINRQLYMFYLLANKLRWFILGFFHP
ncbi:MAG TPA: peptidoglycan bridge formation glycyltransferase FemA/FemB family protein [Patescibacteria group bacterium]|nr:peptidoglycan bridge formation glycyltransferase FemA/FemB family protein [Patescibacteria group bacterium]